MKYLTNNSLFSVNYESFYKFLNVKKASPKWHAVDTTIAIQNMVLTATSEGLSTCWIGSFNENQVKKLLSIPERFRVIALLALGYRRETLELASKVLHFFRRRKKMEKIVSLEEFGNNQRLFS